MLLVSFSGCLGIDSENQQGEENVDLKDSDGDGYPDKMEKAYGTLPNDADSHPLDTDGDGIPDDPSPDGKYEGDKNDDNDYYTDKQETQILDTDPKNKSDPVEDGGPLFEYDSYDSKDNMTVSGDSIYLNLIPTPNIDGKLSQKEKKYATHLKFDFKVSRNGSEFKSYEANIYLGHDMNNFYMGARINNTGLNPLTNFTYTYPDYLNLFFDVENDEKLDFPEDSKRIFTYIMIVKHVGELRQFIHSMEAADHSLIDIPDYATDRNRSVGWAQDCGGAYDRDLNGSNNIKKIYANYTGNNKSTSFKGDQILEVTFPLNSTDILDGIGFEKGKLYKVGFCLRFNRQGETTTRNTPGYTDCWPGRGYNPDTYMNAEEYRTMVIDLTEGQVKPWVDE